MKRYVLLLVLCGAGLCRAEVAARGDDPRTVLTQGVKEIAAPGVPGPLVVWGPNATVVCVAESGKHSTLPVVAAATMGKGRVVAFGHTGYLDGSALNIADTGTLIDNSLRWAGGMPSPRVGVIDNTELVKALSARGFTTTSLPKVWEGALANIDVVCAGQGKLTAAQQKSLHGFITSGHGVLYAGLGWGWMQVTHSSDIRLHPGSHLLRDAGIAWSEGMLEKDAKGHFAAGEVARASQASAALDALEHAKDGDDVEEAAAALTDAVRTLSSDEPLLMGRCRTLLKTHDAAITVGPKSPLRAKQGLERALLVLQVEMDRSLPPEQIKAHPSAVLFPGEVASGAARLAREIRVDRAIPGWHSTGLYAPAGQVITLTATGAVKGCGVRIGCHTDQLWHLDQWQRVPDISRRWDLSPVTKVASPFGGLVYIEVDEKGGDALRVRVAGCVESPRFVLGETTREQWVKSRTTPGPWAELESKKIIVTVPSAAVRGLDDPGAVMQFWDKISDAHATLATIPLERARPERYAADVQISAGYMHSGYPIMTHLDAAESMTSLDKLQKGSWGLLHELGHNHQSGDWTFDGTGEVTCNLFALHAIDTVCTPGEGHRGHEAVDSPPDVKAYIARGANFDEWKKQPFLALQMYIELERAFGWETFKRVFAEYRALPAAERPKTDAEKRDQWMVRFSKACGKNLGPFFMEWGVPTSEEARTSIEGLERWTPAGHAGK